MAYTTLIILAIIAAVVIYFIAIYNHLIRLRNQFKNSFAQIDVQLKRRYDLIPNLVKTAKEYLKHEQDTLERVIAARNEAKKCLDNASKNPQNPGSISSLAQAENMLSNAMGKLNVVVEAYPELKANENMMQLSEELVTAENRVSFARQAYNDQVMEYNTYKDSFPHSLIAKRSGHTRDATLLHLGEREQLDSAPEVNF